MVTLLLHCRYIVVTLLSHGWDTSATQQNTLFLWITRVPVDESRARSQQGVLFVLFIFGFLLFILYLFLYIARLKQNRALHMLLRAVSQAQVYPARSATGRPQPTSSPWTMTPSSSATARWV
jgi:hypothetical protein